MRGNTDMGKSNEYYEIDIMQLLRMLWQKVWVIILSAVIGAVAAFSIAAFLIPPKYEAQALMYVNNSSFSVGSTSFSISNTELTAAQSLVDTYIVILTSRPTLEAVIEDTKVDYDCDELELMISAEAVNNTEVFSITITSEDPKEAELIPIPLLISCREESRILWTAALCGRWNGPSCLRRNQRPILRCLHCSVCLRVLLSLFWS